MVPLPRTLSSLIDMAVEDLRAVMGNPNIYVVHGAFWHEPKNTPEGSRCSVCFAGAVLANRFKTDPTTLAFPSDISNGRFEGVDHRWGELLRVLDMVRIGQISSALEMFGALPPTRWSQVNGIEIASYMIRREVQFSQQVVADPSVYTQAAFILEQEGY